MNLSLILSTPLLIIGIAINLVLAFLVYKNNPQSHTNKIYSLLSLVTSGWLVANYISLQPSFLDQSLFWIRLSIFFAMPMSALFFLLAHTLPKDKIQLSHKKFILAAVLTIFTMVINLSPWAFTDIEVVGDSVNPIPGLGLLPFGLLSTFFSLASVYLLWRKISQATGVERSQALLIVSGMALMLGLVMVTVFVPVVVFKINTFVSFIPLYALIFLGFVAYSIVRHQMFDLKVVATEALVIVLWVVVLARLAISQNSTDIMLNSLIFIFLIFFGVLLIKSVLREVHQREKLEVMTRELQKANNKLKELDKLKSQFLSFASHQLKGPLSIIKVWASFILEGKYGVTTPEVQDKIIKIRDNASELTQLTDNFLDLRKIEEGKFAYDFKVGDLISLAKSIVDSYNIFAKEKNIKLSFAASLETVRVSMDHQKISQVIQNFIDNAIKYTDSGWIKVAVSEDPHHASVVFSVSDSGRGIETRTLSTLFEQFTRDPSVKHIRGTGLGLYIAKKIIDDHKGKIWAESEGEGKGSQFYFELPLAEEMISH